MRPRAKFLAFCFLITYAFLLDKQMKFISAVERGTNMVTSWPQQQTRMARRIPIMTMMWVQPERYGATRMIIGAKGKMSLVQKNTLFFMSTLLLS